MLGNKGLRSWRKVAAGALVIAIPMMSACSNGSDSASNSAPASGSKDTGASKGVVQLNFWHAMGGAAGDALKQVTDDFNNSHPNIHVNLVYQGTYDDEFNKFKLANSGGKDAPNVMQVYDIGTNFMISSGEVIPVQQFIDKEKYDLSAFEPNFLGYYAVNNTQYSLPFNSSNPVLYYNKSAFKDAGLDPSKGPTTFDEVEATSAKLTKKDASGNITQYGFAMANYGWFFEQFLATQNALYANNNNGRGSEIATEAVFNSPEGVKVLQWWKDLFDKKLVANYGTVTSDTQNAFIAGQTAMITESIGALGNLTKGVAGKFEIGVAPFPRPTGANGGVIVGGGSLWIPKKQSDDQQNAAWEFVKYLESPEEQAKWAAATGYFAVRKDAYDQPALKQWLEANPTFQVALDQLHSSPLNEATRGALIGVFPSARSDIQNAISAVLLGSKTPQQALDDTAAKVSKDIQDYNQTVDQ